MPQGPRVLRVPGRSVGIERCPVLASSPEAPLSWPQDVLAACNTAPPPSPCPCAALPATPTSANSCTPLYFVLMAAPPPEAAAWACCMKRFAANMSQSAEFGEDTMTTNVSPNCDVERSNWAANSSAARWRKLSWGGGTTCDKRRSLQIRLRRLVLVYFVCFSQDPPADR